MNKYATLLFEHIDKELDYAAKRIRNRVFSLYRDIPWTPEQYRQLQPLIREELDGLVQALLNSMDNQGCVLPEGVLGYEIIAADEDKDGNYVQQPICDDEFTEYGDMWYEHLQTDTKSSDWCKAF